MFLMMTERSYNEGEKKKKIKATTLHLLEHPEESTLEEYNGLYLFF